MEIQTGSRRQSEAWDFYNSRTGHRPTIHSRPSYFKLLIQCIPHRPEAVENTVLVFIWTSRCFVLSCTKSYQVLLSFTLSWVEFTFCSALEQPPPPLLWKTRCLFLFEPPAVYSIEVFWETGTSGGKTYRLSFFQSGLFVLSTNMVHLLNNANPLWE